MMNLLEDGMKKKTVVLTETSRKLTIDNITKAHQVYKVRIDQLYFNDKNDRIATWISQYKFENDGKNVDMTDKEAYNSVIHDFIVKSNPAALEKTQTNIDLVGQREPGVVLLDGRIIDGNRRFTCLRNLSKKKNETEYFEAVILDRDIENDEKAIKFLELALQHGVDKPVDYNPIDRLVGIYNDLIDKKIFTPEEYAKGVNQKVNEVKIDIEKAQLMIEYLEFINAPKQFHLAREMKLDGPLQEVVSILKKVSDKERKEKLKNAIFINFLLQPEGDMTRYIRQLKKVVLSEDALSEFLEEQMDVAERVLDMLPPSGHVDEKIINEEIRTQTEIKEELSESLEAAVTKSSSKTARERPLTDLSRALEIMNGIDTELLRRMDPEQLTGVSDKLSEIEMIIENVRRAIFAKKS